MRKNYGFSIIELMVVCSIFAVVMTVSLNMYSVSKQSGVVAHDSYAFIDALRLASLKAKSMENDSAWGVKIIGGNTVLFSGTTYATRNTALDKIYDTDNSITMSGPTEIIFAKFSGIPNTSGTTTFSNEFGSTSVAVTAKGVITY